MDTNLIAYTAGAIAAAVGYYLLGRIGRQLWNRQHSHTEEQQ